MRIIIFYDEETNEIWIYEPNSENGDAIFIKPRIEKKDEKSDDKEPVKH